MQDDDCHRWCMPHMLHAVTCHVCRPQMDGFQSDSVRMIQQMRRDAQQPVQILLFSATFNDRVKAYSRKIVRDGGHDEANEVRICRGGFFGLVGILTSESFNLELG